MLYKNATLSAALAVLVMFNGCGDDDDTVIVNGAEIHNQGQDCLSCHADDGFRAAATIYTKMDAANEETTAFAANNTIRLTIYDTNKTITFIKGKGTANAYTKDTQLDTVGAFKVEVLDANGSVVNMNTGSHQDASYLNCNSCHTPDNKGRITGK